MNNKFNYQMNVSIGFPDPDEILVFWVLISYDHFAIYRTKSTSIVQHLLIFEPLRVGEELIYKKHLAFVSHLN